MYFLGEPLADLKYVKQILKSWTQGQLESEEKMSREDLAAMLAAFKRTPELFMSFENLSDGPRRATMPPNFGDPTMAATIPPWRPKVIVLGMTASLHPTGHARSRSV